MIILLSPAKSLMTPVAPRVNVSMTRTKGDSFELIKVLRQLTYTELMELMHISEPLAVENVKRYKTFRKEHNINNSHAAIDQFDGAVYKGLDASSLSDSDMEYAQNNLRMLSGLYGLLRPLDLMHPYRLEMGTKLNTDRGNNLYQFWDDKITKILNRDIKETQSKTIINLASKEYFKAVMKKKLKANILTINFKEFKDGKLKFISFNAKKARGLMARYIISNKITQLEDIKGFNVEDYYFQASESSNDEWIFVR